MLLVTSSFSSSKPDTDADADAAVLGMHIWLLNTKLYTYWQQAIDKTNECIG